MQRVLHVLNNLGSGGAEAFIMNVYRKIDRNKIQFDFLIRSDKNGPFIDEIRAMGGRVFRIAEFPRHILKNYQEAEAFFKEHYTEYRVVHVHANSLIYMKPLQLAKKYGIPCIVHSHNINSADVPFAKFLHSFNKKQVGKYVTSRFACSRAAGEWMFGGDDYCVINNGIDLNKFSFDESKRMRIRTQYHVNDKFVIGHIGRFSPQKNHPLLIKIFHQFILAHPDSVLMMIGEGDGMDEVKSLVQSLSLEDSVIFTGAVSNVDAYLCAMDTFLFPSLFEGFPVALVEVQAGGLPSVISDAIPSDIVLNANCRVCSLEEDIPVWIQALEDNTERIPPCEAVSRYDSAIVAKELEDYYLSVC